MKARFPSQARQYLTFSLAGKTFAMDIGTVREIVQHIDWTTVPLMPRFVRGVINLWGAVVPVIDMQVRLGRVSSALSGKTCSALSIEDMATWVEESTVAAVA